MEVAPTEAMGRGAHEHHARLRWRRDLAGRRVLGGRWRWPPRRLRPLGGYPVGGYVAALLAIGVGRPGRSRGRAGGESRPRARCCGASSARRAAGRPQPGRPRWRAPPWWSAALATAIAMMASVGIMVGSFRETVLVWLDTQLRADLYVRPAGRTGRRPVSAAAPERARRSSRRRPAWQRWMCSTASNSATAASAPRSAPANLDIVRRYGRLRFLPGEDRDAILRSLPGRDRAIVSEPFANKHGVRAGDRLTLPLGDAPCHADRGRHLLRVFEQPGLRDPGPLHAAATTCPASRRPISPSTCSRAPMRRGAAATSRSALPATGW